MTDEKPASTLLRPDLTALPPQLRKLPIDKRGYPVPWFVAWVNGEPEFRAADAEKWKTAVRHKKCWVCGEPLGQLMTFAIGPMCGINRTTAEPPAHQDCAIWSAINCPFLNQKQHKRREDERINSGCPMPGIGVLRQPGVVGLWTTYGYGVFDDGRGGKLINFLDPVNVKWFREGRTATRAEILESIESGFPLLLEAAKKNGTAGVEQLMKQRKQFEKFLPA